MSNRYHVLNGRRSTVLVFGFIYNLPNPSDLVVVQTVEEAVREDWFRDVLTDPTIGYDAILVMLHAGHDDPSVEILRKAIRDITSASGIDVDGDLPIQFIAGHTHYRRYAVADPQSTVVEAGRYMDTVGWVSFPNAETIRKTKDRNGNGNNNKRRRRRLGSVIDASESPNTTTTAASTSTSTSSAVTDLFHHVFLDANVATLRETLGLPRTSKNNNDNDNDDDDFQTALGREVSEFIRETRDSLGLTRKIGCAPKDYQLNVSLSHEDSLWRLYRDEVGPHVLMTVELKGGTTGTGGGTTTATPSSTTEHAVPDRNHRALLMSQDSWRYGLFGGGHLTYDDIIVVSPFNEPVYRVAILPCPTLVRLEESMNTDADDIFYGAVPAWTLSSFSSPNEKDFETPADELCELYVNHFGLSRVENGLKKIVSTGSNSNSNSSSNSSSSNSNSNSTSPAATTPTTVMWDPKETNLTTTSMWLTFVEDNWPCSIDGTDNHWNLPFGGGGGLKNQWKQSPSEPSLHGNEEHSGIHVLNEDGNFTTAMKISFSLFIFCFVVLCSILVCKRRRGTTTTTATNANRLSSNPNYEGVFHDEEEEGYNDEMDGQEFYDNGEDVDSVTNLGETPIRIE